MGLRSINADSKEAIEAVINFGPHFQARKSDWAVSQLLVEDYDIAAVVSGGQRFLESSFGLDKNLKLADKEIRRGELGQGMIAFAGRIARVQYDCFEGGGIIPYVPVGPNRRGVVAALDRMVVVDDCELTNPQSPREFCLRAISKAFVRQLYGSGNMPPEVEQMDAFFEKYKPQTVK